MTARNSRWAMLAALLLLVALAAVYGRARAQVLTPPPDQLRFQALLNEPIATPDRRSVVAGTSALLVKDRRTGQCYVAISVGDSMGMAPADCAE